MSTHGLIAIGTPEAFEGVYCHWDGYPTWMGDKVMEILQGEGGESEFASLIADHDGGWSVLAETCYCHDMDRSHSGRMRKRDAAGVVSWAYVFEPEARKLHVLLRSQRLVASLNIDDEAPTRAEWKQIENSRAPWVN